MKEEVKGEYPKLVAGKVSSEDEAVVRKVLARTKWTESQFVRQLIQLDRDTINHLRTARREMRAA